jgi:hypothetical protein
MIHEIQYYLENMYEQCSRSSEAEIAFAEARAGYEHLLGLHDSETMDAARRLGHVRGEESWKNFISYLTWTFTLVQCILLWDGIGWRTIKLLTLCYGILIPSPAYDSLISAVMMYLVQISCRLGYKIWLFAHVKKLPYI